MCKNIPKFPISVVVLTRNESTNIERCLQSVQWCDDIVVVDDNSSDGTQFLAERLNARVITHEFLSFAHQRNWSMASAGLRYGWVLHLDADEVLTASCAEEIRRQLSTDVEDRVAFQMCRKTMLNGRWLKYSDGFPVWIMRLVHQGHVQFQDSGHGEVAVPKVAGVMGTIHSPFLHYAFSKGWSNWIDRHNIYSTREAELEFESSRSICLGNLFSGEKSTRRRSLRDLGRKMPCRPFLRFCYQYLLKLGFLDGRNGFFYCVMLSFYEFWIVLKHQELRDHQSDAKKGLRSS